MSEEPKNIRLNKAAKELNVGIPTMVEYLAKKGHQVEANPNARLTAEQYALLSTAFQSERQVKENADRIEISTGNSVTIEATNVANNDDSTDYNDEIIIKNFNTPKTKIAVEQKTTEQSNQEETPSETPTIEEVKESESQNEAPIQTEEEKPEEPKFETKILRSSVAGAKEGKNAFDAEVRIIDKIDLSSINQRTRPGKSGKAEREERQQKKKNEAAAQKQKATAQKQKTAETEKNTQPTPPVQQPQPEKAPEKEIEFIETQYQKLEGPKVVSKIDLTQFDKPKGKGRDEEKKKKRKRIKKEGVKVDENSTQPSGKNADNSKQQGGGKSGKDKKSEKNKKNKNAEKKKVDVDDAEIEKQIKETLARLSPMGKSKTSKHNREKRQKVHQHIEEEQLREMENQKTLQVTEFVTANELATMMNTPVTQIISTCMSVGIFVSINQRLDAETTLFFFYI